MSPELYIVSDDKSILTMRPVFGEYYTIHEISGKIRGFVMYKLDQYEPIHKLYGPAHRKQVFPNANWAFLLHTAKNLAAAFATIHSNGHIIGDINQGNVYVAPDSTVKLIDCDSFQMFFNNKIYPCEVGISHFTPPEMQALKSYNGFHRTQNHDNFGLAVLCFHLLFMGRHPFSGIYQGKHYLTLEEAIKNYQFAFGKKPYLREVKPPPNCITMEVIPDNLANLFELAFTENTSSYFSRPTAVNWFGVLDNFEKQLVTCRRESIHVYYRNLPNCPWCQLEEKSGILFFVSTLNDSIKSPNFNIEKIWSKIVSIQSPGPAPVLDLNKIKVSPTPLPPEVLLAKVKIVSIRIIAVLMLIFSIFLAIGLKIFGIVIIGLFISMAINKASEKNSPEYYRRKNILVLAEKDWKEKEKEWERATGDYVFKDKLNYLHKIRNEYKNLPAKYSKEKQNLHSTIRERQLNKYLSQFFIDNYRITSIGQGRKAILSSFGIETAADITMHRILNIDGFGPYLTKELMLWRKSIENKFVFNPQIGIDPYDIKALNHKFQNEKNKIENQLLTGIELLVKAKNEALENKISKLVIELKKST